MSTADDDEKTITGPAGAHAARLGPSADDPETGVNAERRRGRDAAANHPGHTLPLGTRLRDYEITGLIGEGGFGIVYLAWDHSLQRKVAIKEYMPASMAARVNGSSAIVVKSERHLDTFRAGLKSFVNEARLLARFDHPSLVKVYRFWEENGTAYMVMPYYDGPTLKTALAELGHVPSEEELRAWLAPLLDALAVMHAAQCYHRDIAPDNILLTPRGPLLLDFGAARRVIGDMTHAITVVLKPGYAPIEQYGDVASMTQGAWTDLYALACVVYYAITGKTPMSSVERLMDDRMEPLSVTAAGRYSPAFLRAFDAALSVRPNDRPQNEQQFRALLDADRPAPPRVVAPRPPPQREDGDSGYSTMPATLMPELPTRLLPRVAAAAKSEAVDSPIVESDIEPMPVAIAPPVARGRGAGIIAAVVVGLVVVAAALFWWLRPHASATPAVAADNPASAPALARARAPTPALALPAVAPAASTAASATPIVVESPPASSATAILPPAPTKPRREAVVPRSEPRNESHSDPLVAPKSTPPRPSSAGSRCSDILQKASLEALSAEEANYLKRECR